MGKWSIGRTHIRLLRLLRNANPIRGIDERDDDLFPDARSHSGHYRLGGW